MSPNHPVIVEEQEQELDRKSEDDLMDKVSETAEEKEPDFISQRIEREDIDQTGIDHGLDDSHQKEL